MDGNVRVTARTLPRRSMLRLAALAGTAAGSGFAATGAAAQTVPGADEGIRNVRVSADGYGLHAEPSLAINPRDPRNLLGASQAWTGDSSQGRIVTYASFDGGAHWRSNGPLPLPPDTVLANDVTVSFDSTGHGFLCAMATSGRSTSDRGVYVWRTDDGGRSFHAPVTVVAGVFADHPWLAVDGAGRLHVAWVVEGHAGLGYARSSDGGRTFDTARMISQDNGASAPMVAAAIDGTVYVIFTGTARGADPDADGSLDGTGPAPQRMLLVRSTDGGQTFGGTAQLSSGVTSVVLPGQVLPVTLPAVAAAPHGRGYAAFVTQEPGATSSRLMIACTTDRGANWRAEIPVTPDDGAVYFQPQLAVDVAGRVSLTAFALVDGQVDVLLWTTPHPGSGFGPPRRITSRSFDPALAVSSGKHGVWWIGDYQGLAVSPAAVHPFWNDTRTGQLEIFTARIRPV